MIQSLYIRLLTSRQRVNVCQTNAYCVEWLWLSLELPFLKLLPYRLYRL